MFVWNPVWASHCVLFLFFWKDSNFDVKPALTKIMSREYLYFIWPMNLITTWFVWLPAVSVIYSLPSALQIPLFCIAICFWSILLQLLTKKTGDGSKSDDEDHETSRHMSVSTVEDSKLATSDMNGL